MSSSAQNHNQHFQAPPPTPSTTHPTTTTTTSATDFLSSVLHRLPPNLSTTPFRRRPSSLTTPPIIPYTTLNSTLPSLLTSISELGFFQLSDHPIPSHLAHAANLDSFSIFNLSSQKKLQHFSNKNWPIGFDNQDTDKDKDKDSNTDDDDEVVESLFLDTSCLTELNNSLSLSSLREFFNEMEKVGLSVAEALMRALGLRGLEGSDGVCSMMSICDKICESSKFYPYVVALHYQFMTGKCSLLVDSGMVSVTTQVDSILVTLGDIAQVWSNGKLKKVRGKPTLSIEEGSDSSSLSMSLLITLPLESTVSPLPPRAVISDRDDTDTDNEDNHDESSEERMFNSFSFEDYAWRVYHERVPLKDPLNRYRTQT